LKDRSSIGRTLSRYTNRVFLYVQEMQNVLITFLDWPLRWQTITIIQLTINSS